MAISERDASADRRSLRIRRVRQRRASHGGPCSKPINRYLQLTAEITSCRDRRPGKVSVCLSHPTTLPRNITRSFLRRRRVLRTCARGVLCIRCPGPHDRGQTVVGDCRLAIHGQGLAEFRDRLVDPPQRFQRLAIGNQAVLVIRRRC